MDSETTEGKGGAGMLTKTLVRIRLEQHQFLKRLRENAINPAQWIRIAIDEKMEREKHKYPFAQEKEAQDDKAA